MRIGKMDQRVILQSATETNSFGEVTKTYTTEATVWAHVISQKGSETFEAARVNARETIRVKIRYRDDVNLKWRIQWMSQTYNILYIDRSARRNDELWMTCEVVGAE